MQYVVSKLIMQYVMSYVFEYTHLGSKPVSAPIYRFQCMTLR